MGIELKTRKMLWGRSANRCAFPECRKKLVEDETQTDDASIIGDEAHIVARKVDGPRGKSNLTPEQRDKYDNLILLCKKHHKIIDDQEIKYTTDYLHQLKEDHINWVDSNLDQDKEVQYDDELYAGYVDQWLELGGINTWNDWATSLLSSGQPSIPIYRYKQLRKLNEYLYGRIWPKRYPNVEFAFENFRLILNEFLQMFDKYRNTWGEHYEVKKIYQELRTYDEVKYNRLLNKFDYHVDLIEDLVCELTRSANYLCDMIRENLSRSFRTKEGVILISSGPNAMLQWRTLKLEYGNIEVESIKYKGLRDFMLSRETRDGHFGSGINEDYFFSI